MNARDIEDKLYNDEMDASEAGFLAGYDDVEGYEDENEEYREFESEKGAFNEDRYREEFSEEDE